MTFLTKKDETVTTHHPVQERPEALQAPAQAALGTEGNARPAD